MNNELQRLRKEVVVIQFMVLSRCLPGGAKRSKKDLGQGSWFLGRYCTMGILEFEVGMLATRPQPSILVGNLY